MPIYKLEKLDGDDMSKAKLIIAEEKNLELEKHLENWLENSPWVLIQNSILWIGRQTSATDEDGTIYSDLLGIDSDGNLVIAELKKGRTPRDIIAQLLDYAAWADGLSESQIREIAKAYFEIAVCSKEKLSMMPSERYLTCLKPTNFPDSMEACVCSSSRKKFHRE